MIFVIPNWGPRHYLFCREKCELVRDCDCEPTPAAHGVFFVLYQKTLKPLHLKG